MELTRAAFAAPRPAARAAKPSTHAQRSRRLAWRLVAPTLAVLAAVAGWPLARSVWFSLTDARLSALAERRFVGLANYAGADGVLRDPGWWSAVWNTLAFTGVSVTLETVLGVGVALLLDHPSRWRTLLRAAVLVPWAIPTVVSARMWAWMLHDQFGIVNAALVATGLVAQPLAWTADPRLAFVTVVAVDVWKTTPFMALLALAALQSVPRDCLAAARIDGAPPWRVFTRITLPLIRPALAVAVVFRALDALRVFDVIYVMTSNSRATRSMSIYVREQLIDFQHVGRGSAAATLLLATIAAATAAFVAIARLRADEAR